MELAGDAGRESVERENGLSAQIFGKYEVIRRLALGGMGEVFLARQTGVAVDRLVILKSLLPELAEQPGFIEQFLDEARVAATLNHPNIVAIYEVGLWNGVYFIAMEYIHGADLSKLQRAAAQNRIVLPFQVSARIIHDSCLALDHAHFAKDVNGNPLNIVHRDISPQNIMVRTDGVSKVVDFGIAKASNTSTRTATGMLKGKLQYMPPEQVRGEVLDGRSDQFALGAVLWEMTTGKRLFKGANELETLERILKHPIPPPSTIVPGFPRELEAVILRMLQRDPAHRFSRCKEAAKQLQTYLDASSRHVGEQQVADFVHSAMGDALEKVTSDLTPTAENFLIRLGGSHDDDEEAAGFTPTTSRKVVATLPNQKSKAAWAIGAAAALFLTALCAIALVLLIQSDDDGENAVRRVDVNDTVAPDPVYTLEGNVLRITAPKGAQIKLDGVARKETVPAVIADLATGMHQIVVVKDDVPSKPKLFKVEAVQTQLKVTSEPSGATVYLNGKTVGETPLFLDDTSPGTVALKLRKRRYVTETHEVEIQAGTTKTVHYALDRARSSGSSSPPPAPKPTPVAKAPAAPKYGYVTLNSSPWAKITIDGKPFGSTPIFKKKVSAGRHKVRLVNEEMGVNVSRTITVEGGRVLKRNWKLK